jgi:hypothetical protein
VVAAFALSTLTVNAQKSTKEIKAKDLLQGSWFDNNDDNAEFFIIGDSIGYPDDMSKYKYTLKNDTLDILTTQPHYKQVIQKITEDSLIMKNLPDRTISRYWHN